MIRRFARPYARAITDVTGSPEKASAVRQELALFARSLGTAADLQEMFTNPGIDLESKLKVSRTIGGRLGLSELSMKVLEVLIRNHRINNLDTIVEALAEMIRQQTGTVAAEVRSAHALDEAQRNELLRILEKKAGRKVELVLIVDPALIGGFVAKIGSQVYNASVIGKIAKFRESLI
jgi:F-type H+-transporting ATPase subunit delta